MLRRELGLDGGYLSRILRAFASRRLIDKMRSRHDGRQRLLSLTDEGRKAFAMLNARSEDEAGAILGELSAEDQVRLVKAMHTIEGILGSAPEP